MKDDPTDINDDSYEGLVIANPLTVGISQGSHFDTHTVSDATQCNLDISGGRSCIYL